MKAISIWFATLFLCSLLHAQTSQGTMNLSLTVKNNQGQPLASTKVEFVEVNTRETREGTTDAAGQLEFRFTTGRYWQINILEIRDYFFWQIEVVPGKNFNLSKTVTYDVKRFERESRPAVDRSVLSLRTEVQSFQPDEKGAGTMGVIRLEIKKADDSPLRDFPVALTCYALKTTFSSKTNPAGIATFKVPVNNEYEVDIDGIPSFSYVDIPDRPGYTGSKTFTYEPTVVKETTVRDTTVQELPAGQEGTTGRVITQITLKGGPEGVWRNEPVFLEVIGERHWYKGRTNQLGEVHFLLPKGKKYMIHGRFEYDLDVIDLTRRRGVGYSNKSVLYRPVDKYQFPEKYIPKPEEIIVDDFLKFLDKVYPKPEADQEIAIRAEWGGVVNASASEAVMRVAITTNVAAAASKAPPLNLALVIDKSGSMAGHDRIDQLKLSLEAYVNKLRTKDILSLVVFDHLEMVVIPAQEIGAGKEHFLNAIRRLEAGGGTTIAPALIAGYKELMKNFNSGKVNRLLLMTDGYGSEPVEETIEAQKPYVSRGAECTAVGVGEGYNYALLHFLATKGGGIVEHVGSAEDMQKAFLRSLDDVLYPIGKNAEIEVEFHNQLNFKQLFGAPLTSSAPGKVKYKLKNIFAGLDQLALIRFNLVNPKPGIQDLPVTVRIRYTDVNTGKVVTKEEKVPLKWSDKVGEAELIYDQNEKKLYAAAVLNQSMKVMADKFHAGDLPGAKAAIESGISSLQRVYPAATDTDLTLLKEQLLHYLDIIQMQSK